MKNHQQVPKEPGDIFQFPVYFDQNNKILKFEKLKTDFLMFFLDKYWKNREVIHRNAIGVTD